jgi:hypothetical protein
VKHWEKTFEGAYFLSPLTHINESWFVERQPSRKWAIIDRRARNPQRLVAGPFDSLKAAKLAWYLLDSGASKYE